MRTRITPDCNIETEQSSYFLVVEKLVSEEGAAIKDQQRYGKAAGPKPTGTNGNLKR
jgi:hypothetical protein